MSSFPATALSLPFFAGCFLARHCSPGRSIATGGDERYITVQPGDKIGNPGQGTVEQE